MKSKIYKIKQRLKQIASDIRNFRSKRKEASNGYIPELRLLCPEARHTHIAYCLARGRKYKWIESPAEDNTPNWAWISNLYEEITGTPYDKEAENEEALCANS